MILDPGMNLTLRPMRDPTFYEMYRNAIKNTWTIEEVDFSTDLMDLRMRMSSAERHLINRLVAFFNAHFVRRTERMTAQRRAISAVPLGEVHPNQRRSLEANCARHSGLFILAKQLAGHLLFPGHEQRTDARPQKVIGTACAQPAQL